MPLFEPMKAAVVAMALFFTRCKCRYGDCMRLQIQSRQKRSEGTLASEASQEVSLRTDLTRIEMEWLICVTSWCRIAHVWTHSCRLAGRPAGRICLCKRVEEPPDTVCRCNCLCTKPTFMTFMRPESCKTKAGEFLNPKPPPSGCHLPDVTASATTRRKTWGPGKVPFHRCSFNAQYRQRMPETGVLMGKNGKMLASKSAIGNRQDIKSPLNPWPLWTSLNVCTFFRHVRRHHCRPLPWPFFVNSVDPSAEANQLSVGFSFHLSLMFTSESELSRRSLAAIFESKGLGSPRDRSFGDSLDAGICWEKYIYRFLMIFNYMIITIYIYIYR